MDQVSKEYLKFLELHDSGFEDEASRFLCLAVKRGDPLAEHTLAEKLFSAEPADLNKALCLYRRAARKCFEPSMIHLARHYELKRNARRYFFWLNKAIALGSEDAAVDLAKPFRFLVSSALAKFEHDGDVCDALKSFKLASRYGNTDAMVNIANIFDIYIDPPRPKQARALYLKAANLGNITARKNLVNHDYDANMRIVEGKSNDA